MSVTPSADNYATRNAELEELRQQGEHPEEVYVRCQCGARLTHLLRPDGGLTRPVNCVHDPDPHCSTCHSHEHFACLQCGACLPEWAPVRELHRDGRWQPSPRFDKRYCSPACRQKAYRQRVKEAREALAGQKGPTV